MSHESKPSSQEQRLLDDIAKAKKLLESAELANAPKQSLQVRLDQLEDAEKAHREFLEGGRSR